MRALITLLAFCMAAASAPAQVTAPKLVRIIVPFAAGASNDAIARAMIPSLSKRLETSMIVENRPGAAGVIGADAVAKAPRDGSVLLLTSSSFLTAAATQPKLPYEPIGAFTPIAMIGQGPLVLAVPGTAPFKTTAQLIAAARAKPGDLTYGTAGVGSVGHLATELFNSAAKIRATHVPYKGAAIAAIDLAGGQIGMMLTSFSTVQGLARTGKLRTLAVTSAKPHPAFGELPTVASTVPGFAIDIWVGVFAPAGTPTALVDRYNREINEVAPSPDLAVLLEPEGTVPVAMTSAAFAARVKQELVQWKQIAADRKIVAE